MSVVKNLEALIKIENDLKSQYESKLNAQLAEIQNGVQKQEELQKKIDAQKDTISKLSAVSTDKKRLEQVNRELSNRAEKLQDEVDAQKKRIKTTQKDSAEARAEVKKLRHLDAEKLKKNLVANKKKLAEKSKATDLLQKSLNKTKSENIELQQEVDKLKAELEELKPAEEESIETEAEVETAEAEVETAEIEVETVEVEVETAEVETGTEEAA